MRNIFVLIVVYSGIALWLSAIGNAFAFVVAFFIADLINEFIYQFNQSKIKKA